MIISGQTESEEATENVRSGVLQGGEKEKFVLAAY